MRTILPKIAIAFIFVLSLIPSRIFAQQPGDTIRVKTFHYASNTRDTMAYFPKGNLTFEKIVLRYNMRCKNGLISDGSNRNKGCGEWDYSCNTFLVDSSQIEVVPQTAPKFVISNFEGSQFSYTSKPVYDYYDYTTIWPGIKGGHSTTTYYPVGASEVKLKDALNTSQYSVKTLVLYRAQELIDANFDTVTGNYYDRWIRGILLQSYTGGIANFLRIRIQHTKLNKLDALTPPLTGYTEVYYATHEFEIGCCNKIEFYKPFVWDGVSNLLFEFSFSNTTPDSGIILGGYNDTNVCMLTAQNNYSVDFSGNGRIILAADSLSKITDEISIAFWAKGNPKLLPANTSVMYGWDTDPNQRQLNIHFPWSDGNIYFDCGYAAGGFDRINKAATPAEYEGNWNYWVFVKNSTQGYMSIFINGDHWLTGKSKNKSMTLNNLILGSDQNGNNNYKGKINRLSIWNRVLTTTEMKELMEKPIDNKHPKYENLIAYYPFQEGSGKTIIDLKSTNLSKANNIVWSYDRGETLSRFFTENNSKPKITLIKGNYSGSNLYVEQRDSILRAANGINRYVVEDKSAAGIVTHDLLKIDSTFSLYEARKSMVYKGETDVLLDSIPVKSEGVLDLGKLNYSLRFPWYNELVSFVTPYGINLDLGMAGKSWYLDMTDYAPLLKENKRLVVAMGGQNQEQMEMEFMFIVGTPVRSVLEFNQLWQGGARLGGPGINSILNNSVFAPMNVPLLSNAKSFKLRSTITGHGSDGEFEQNGGPITHTINVAGKSASWSSVVDCSVNPMIAQGGTWLIPRQGWCPGQRSKLIEHEITKWVTPGKSETIDYEISQPTKSGDYRYIVAHQLVSYGDLSFTNDAKIVQVVKPTKDYEYSKTNPICSQPVILVQNTGKTEVKTLQFTYWANNASVKQLWHWAGNLASLDTVSITLPTWGLWDNGMLPSNNVFHCEISEVNGQPDAYPMNSKASTPVAMPDVLPANFKIEFRTNNYPKENSITLLDVDGKVVLRDSFTVANKTTVYPLSLNGCYKLIVNDYGLDGLYWWANTAQGTGFARLRNGNTNALIKTFNADFGSFFEYNFTTNYALKTSELDFGNTINVYPNPATNKFSLEGEGLENARVEVFNVIGGMVDSRAILNQKSIDFNTENWNPGVYVVEITQGSLKATKKVVVY